jgi:hypothetical protein
MPSSILLLVRSQLASVGREILPSTYQTLTYCSVLPRPLDGNGATTCRDRIPVQIRAARQRAPRTLCVRCELTSESMNGRSFEPQCRSKKKPAERSSQIQLSRMPRTRLGTMRPYASGSKHNSDLLSMPLPSIPAATTLGNSVPSLKSTEGMSD